MTKNNEEEILKEEIDLLKEEAKILDKEIDNAHNNAPKNHSNSALLISISIILAGGLIGAGLFFSGYKLNDVKDSPVTGEMEEIIEISEDDHIMGDRDAMVKIIEYSDMECPFCKNFHSTMNRIMSEYNSNEVAWVYRHWPIMSTHPKAYTEAIASECAAELGGNDKFWEYTNLLFETTPSNNRLDLDELPRMAEAIGLDVEEFNACMDSGEERHGDTIDLHSRQANTIGATGTPFSILIERDGNLSAIPGAFPYEEMKRIIDEALQ